MTVRYRDGRGRRHAVAGHHAVVTTPVWTLPELGLDPGLDAASRHAVAFTGAGTYVKVVLRLRERVGRLWDCHGGGPWTLLTDGDAGCVYALGDEAAADGHGDEPDDRDEVVTMLIPSAPARALTGRPSQQIAARAIRSLDQLVARTPGGSAGRLCAGVAGAVTDVRVVDHPRAVAYWPQRCGRSRFDALATALRAPHGRVLIGGDSTDASHSDGAVRAAQRMAATILAGSPERACELEQTRRARAGRCREMTVLERLGDLDVVAPPTGERAKLRRELGRLDTIFFLISAMVVVDTIGAVAIGSIDARDYGEMCSRPRKGWHVTDIALCPRQRVFKAIDPLPLTDKELSMVLFWPSGSRSCAVALYEQPRKI